MREDVLVAVALMVRDEPSLERSEAVVQQLVSQGYSPIRATLSESFINIAFGRAWIRKLTGPPVRLADTAQIWCEGNKYREVRLAHVPEFTEALAVADEALATGSISWEQFSRCCDSAEVDCINQAIKAGRFAGGGTMSPPILMRLSEVPGFEDWYRETRSKCRRWWRFWG